MSDEKEIKAVPPTYSVKTTSDITESVGELLKVTGLSQKELFAAMVTQFKTNLLASSDTEQTEDMQQLRYHLSHAESIFTNMVQKLHDLKENFTESIDQEKRVHQGIVDQVDKSRLHAEVERDKARLDLAEIQDQLKELSERNSELEAVNKSNRITIELLTNQNETLEARIGTVAEMEAEVQELRAQRKESRRQIEKLITESSQHLHVIEIKEQAITTREKTHAGELASMQKMADLQIHAAGIDANNRVLESTAKLKDEYTVKIDTLQDRIQTLTARIHEFELGKTRTKV